MKIDIITENHILKSKTQDLVNEFFDIDKLSIVNDKQLQIIISKNYESDLLENSNELATKCFIENGIPQNKAIIILPDDANYSKFVIIVKEKIFEDREYFSTITHELTHVIDFINHFDEFGNIYRGNAIYDDFFFWTEFNAKKAGLERLQLELNKTGQKISLEDSANNFILENNQTLSADKKVYNLVHFLARISIYDETKNLDFDEREFPRQYLITLFGQKTFALYNLLNIADSYGKFRVYRKSIDETLDELAIYN
jgi:hypothetical protein